jgi:hypothetical protein
VLRTRWVPDWLVGAAPGGWWVLQRSFESADIDSAPTPPCNSPLPCTPLISDLTPCLTPTQSCCAARAVLCCRSWPPTATWSSWAPWESTVSE